MCKLKCVECIVVRLDGPFKSRLVNVGELTADISKKKPQSNIQILSQEDGLRFSKPESLNTAISEEKLRQINGSALPYTLALL